MNSYVARQPIFDRKLKIFAYELLYCCNEKSMLYQNIDADKASLYTTMESFYTMGIESLTDKKPAFISFTSHLILEDIPTLFPCEVLVIEIPEDTNPTPDVVAECNKLVEDGYTIALNDFVYKPELESLIDLCSIIKINFKKTSIQQKLDSLNLLKARNKKIVAEKIETIDMFKEAVKMGFTLFQGFFFCKPVTISTKRLEPMKVSHLSLIEELSEGNEADYGRLAGIIRNDVALCYKLLRMVNSVYYNLLQEITDIRQALVVLGLKEIQKWVYVMAILDLCSKKPDELVRTSMIRAFFMEQISLHSRFSYTQANLFLLGIFSLIDVLMERPMQIALSGLMLAPAIVDALVLRKGRLYDFLRLAISIENGEWEETDQLGEFFEVSTRQISEAYIRSVKWCDELIQW